MAMYKRRGTHFGSALVSMSSDASEADGSASAGSTAPGAPPAAASACTCFAAPARPPPAASACCAEAATAAGRSAAPPSAAAVIRSAADGGSSGCIFPSRLLPLPLPLPRPLPRPLPELPVGAGWGAEASTGCVAGTDSGGFACSPVCLQMGSTVLHVNERGQRASNSCCLRSSKDLTEHNLRLESAWQHRAKLVPWSFCAAYQLRAAARHGAADTLTCSIRLKRQGNDGSLYQAIQFGSDVISTAMQHPDFSIRALLSSCAGMYSAQLPPLFH